MCSKSSTVVEQCPGIVVGVETGEIGPPWGTAVATLQRASSAAAVDTKMRDENNIVNICIAD